MKEAKMGSLLDKIMAFYPFLKDLSIKFPGLKKGVEKAINEDNPMVELQLETLQKVTDIEKTIEILGYISAKLSNPEAQLEHILRARKFAQEAYDVIHKKWHIQMFY